MIASQSTNFMGTSLTCVQGTPHIEPRNAPRGAPKPQHNEWGSDARMRPSGCSARAESIETTGVFRHQRSMHSAAAHQTRARLRAASVNIPRTFRCGHSDDTLLNPRLPWATPPRRRQAAAPLLRSATAASRWLRRGGAAKGYQVALLTKGGLTAAFVQRRDSRAKSLGAPREGSVPARHAPRGFGHSTKPAANRPGPSRCLS